MAGHVIEDTRHMLLSNWARIRSLGISVLVTIAGSQFISQIMHKH